MIEKMLQLHMNLPSTPLFKKISNFWNFEIYLPQRQLHNIFAVFGGTYHPDHYIGKCHYPQHRTYKSGHKPVFPPTKNNDFIKYFVHPHQVHL